MAHYSRRNVVAAVFLLLAAAEAEVPVAVETSLGPVVGLAGADEDGVDSFRGIRFAVVGERFSRSTLVVPGGEGQASPINATSYGPSCYQSFPPGMVVLEEAASALPPEDEECLYLNIWRPSSAASAPSSPPLPTMVFVHGGGFSTGSGAEPTYNGARLAAAQGVVVVTINYRLGLFGGLVTDPTTGAGGLNFVDDQINALRWVQEHVASFGGDPGNVTVFGESAGSASVCMLSVSPLAGGLFRRSILQSGGCAFGMVGPVPPEAGAVYAQAVVDAAGASSVSDLANASKFPPQDIAPLATSIPNAAWLAVDGLVLPEHPSVLYQDPDNVVPTDVIVGSNSYDSVFALVYPPGVYVAQASSMEAQVGAMFGNDTAKRVLAAYAPDRYDDNPVAAYSQFWGDYMFRCPSRQLAAHLSGRVAGRVFLYNYARLSPLDPSVANGLYDLAGIDDPTYATHAAELPLVFGTFDDPGGWFGEGALSASEEDLAVSGEMMARWGAFAKNGDPNTDSYDGWDPVPPPQEKGGASSISLKSATNIPAFVFKQSGGEMSSVEAKADQCLAFFPPASPEEDEEDEPTEGPIDSAAYPASGCRALHLVTGMAAVVACQACLLSYF